MKETTAPPTRLPLASLTVAVAVEVEVPSAGREDGLRATVTVAGAVAVSVRVAVPDLALAVAVIVSWSAVIDALTVTEHVPNVGPEDAVVQVAPPGKVASPLVVKVTGALAHEVGVGVFHGGRGRGGGGAVGRRWSGLRATVTVAGAVANSVRVAVPDLAPEVAVIVSWSAVTDGLDGNRAGAQRGPRPPSCTWHPRGRWCPRWW